VSEAVRFLHALAQALSTMNLYAPGHPAAARSIEHLWEALQALLAVDEHPVFLFLGDAPVYDGRPLHELRNWQPARRLAAFGVQRVEVDRQVTRESLAKFLAQVMVRFTAMATEAAEAVEALEGIVYGTVAVQDIGLGIAADGEPGGLIAVGGGVANELDFSEELGAMGYVLSEAAAGRVARAEAEAIVRILGGALDEVPLVQAASPDAASHGVVHPVNTALITMAAATATGIDRIGRHRLGVVAILHDIGMAQLRQELTPKTSLTAAERAEIECHTSVGAELLLQGGGRGMELAAVVAYEHHLRPDGSGYPVRRFAPPPHWASRLVGTCSVFTALRAPRPFRPRWAEPRAVAYLEEGAGTVFDHEAARLVAAVVSPA
jgi:HD-GYP domain-containing protein (c-di-GMP phosphodiesterase class II)